VTEATLQAEADSAADAAADADELGQFRDMLAWSAELNTPDPGHSVSLRQYVPVDMLQVGTYFYYWNIP
jgi:hypothetical protein